MGEAMRIRIAGRDDLEGVADLLRECDLPTEGVEENLSKWYVIAEQKDELVGVCGIEVCGPYGLLRSLAVPRPWRGMSFGRALVDDRIAWARTEGIRALYLLTMNADRYFVRFGFRRISRDRVPAEIKSSPEFSSLCPETAIVMVKPLGDRGRTEFRET